MTTERPPGPADERESERRRLERILPELIKRVVETGYEKIADGYERITEGPENVREFVRDMKLPKEAMHLLLSQLDETKNGLYRVVAKEIRDFLEHTNLSDELSRALTTLSFEIKTEVRFIPNDARGGTRPDIRAKVRVKKDRPPEEPPPTDASETPPPPEEEDPA